ncbi:MAG: InlB B-repeat-containing protein, partial [Malacoplasma sp.]|nr:InlB B-repeat-containing protein [Malacoplasma sp.]
MISRKNRKALFFSSLGVFVAASSVLTTSCATSSLKEEKREQEEYVKYNVSISTDYKGFVVVDGKKAPSYNKKIAIGRDISFSVEPYDGYVFDHWSDGSTDISRSITVYDNINIVAIFKERPFTSTPIKNYKLNVNSTAGGNIYLGGKRIDIPYNQEYQSSTKVKLAAKPSDNYAFTGWSDGVNDSIRTVTINDEVTLFATFTRAPLKPCEFNIYRSVNGKVQIDGVDINVPYQQTYLENTTIEVKAIAESDEYIFNGWDDGVEENPRTITFEKDDITFSPIFSPIGGQPFTIQLRKPDNGKYRIANNLITSSYEQTFNSGSEVLVEAIADANYKFERWSDNLTVNPRPINKGVEDLYPIFVPIKFTVDLKKPTNGHYEINDQTINDGFNQTYDVGQSIEVKAVANKDFVFDHWSDNTTANPKTISSNTEGLYPIFVACDFTIKLAKPEHGYYLVNKEPIHYEYSATFKNGKSVTIEAIPLKDYKLRSWNDNSTDAIKTITQSAELSATFIPKRIILKVQKPEEGTCTINGTAIKETFDQEVQYEQKFEIVVTADVGYKFDHWNNSPSDTNPVKQITITESMSLVPYFTTL